MKKHTTFNVIKSLVTIITIFLMNSLSAQVIVIDPGHGYCSSGNDSGHQGGLYNHEARLAIEHETAFVVGSRLKKELNASCPDLKVYLTRTNNNRPGKFVGVTARRTMSNSWGADRFLSIHTNAGGGTGTETFWCDKSTPSNSRLQAFGNIIQNEMVGKGEWFSRGLKIDDIIFRDRGGGHLGVLRANNAASVLSEIGFGDNPSDARKLASSTWRDRFVEAYKAGLLKSLKVNCTSCTNTKTLTGVIASGTYKSLKLIVASGIIASGRSVTFNAPSGITLTPGFVAKEGATFSAKIGRGCTGSKEAAFFDGEGVIKENISISPNPSSGIITIRYTSISQDPITLRITDITGKSVEEHQLLHQDNAEVFEQILDLTHFKSGIYFCTYLQGNTIVTKKIMKY